MSERFADLMHDNLLSVIEMSPFYSLDWEVSNDKSMVSENVHHNFSRYLQHRMSKNSIRVATLSNLEKACKMIVTIVLRTATYQKKESKQWRLKIQNPSFLEILRY